MRFSTSILLSIFVLVTPGLGNPVSTNSTGVSKTTVSPRRRPATEAEKQQAYSRCLTGSICPQVFPESCFCANNLRRDCARRTGVNRIMVQDCATQAYYIEIRNPDGTFSREDECSYADNSCSCKDDCRCKDDDDQVEVVNDVRTFDVGADPLVVERLPSPARCCDDFPRPRVEAVRVGEARPVQYTRERSDYVDRPVVQLDVRPPQYRLPLVEGVETGSASVRYSQPVDERRIIHNIPVDSRGYVPQNIAGSRYNAAAAVAADDRTSRYAANIIERPDYAIRPIESDSIRRLPTTEQREREERLRLSREERERRERRERDQIRRDQLLREQRLREQDVQRDRSPRTLETAGIENHGRIGTVVLLNRNGDRKQPKK